MTRSRAQQAAHATLAKFSRPRLYNVLKRERLFARLDAARAHPIIWIAGPPGRGQVDAGRQLCRLAQAERHLVPDRRRRRRPRNVLPLSVARRGGPRGRAGKGRRRAAALRPRVRERPAGVHAPFHARVLRAVSARLAARRRQLPRSAGRGAVALRLQRRGARASRGAQPAVPLARCRCRRRWCASSPTRRSRASTGRSCASPQRRPRRSSEASSRRRCSRPSIARAKGGRRASC